MFDQLVLWEDLLDFSFNIQCSFWVSWDKKKQVLMLPTSDCASVRSPSYKSDQIKQRKIKFMTCFMWCEVISSAPVDHQIQTDRTG